MEYRVIFPIQDSGCSGGDCPTVYQTDRGTFLVQGYTLDKAEKDRLSIPENEDVIELPASFLSAFVENGI